jgi:hypothetical protein
MKRTNAIIGLIMLLALVIGVPGVLWLMLSGLVTWISSQDSQVAAAVIAGAATVLVGFGAVILSQQRAKTREIAESHRPRKIELYTGFIKKTMEFMQKYKEDNAEGALVKDTELEKFFADFTTNLVLWGSAGVVRAYAKFRKASREGAPLNSVIVMDDVIRAMRRDLGHSDWLLRRGELIKTFLRDPEELDTTL